MKENRSESIHSHEQLDNDDNINHLIRRLFHEHLLTFKEQFHGNEGHDNVGWGHQRIIFHLLHHEGDSQANIAKTANLSRPTVNKTISSMEEKGLVYKVKDDTKKRGYKLFLTEKGKKLRKPFQEMFNDLQSAILEGFSEDDEEKLKEYLNRMIDNLQAYRKEHPEGDTEIKVMFQHLRKHRVERPVDESKLKEKMKTFIEENDEEE